MVCKVVHPHRPMSMVSGGHVFSGDAAGGGGTEEDEEEGAAAAAAAAAEAAAVVAETEGAAGCEAALVSRLASFNTSISKSREALHARLLHG